NPFAMQEIADALRGTDVPVLVKNPVSPDLELWIGAIERIYNAGIRR
ncbi:MAG TPA: 3-deoxy-7-phosphoheptulonate synthase, partial [Alistipes sp.]|nr:3-deoxy-7-phosphoheptulonate synthase [Alistipes sp.]